MYIFEITIARSKQQINSISTGSVFAIGRSAWLCIYSSAVHLRLCFAHIIQEEGLAIINLIKNKLRGALNEHEMEGSGRDKI